MMTANDIEIPDIDALDLNTDNFDTSEFWKSRDEKEQISLNEKLLDASRHGPSEVFKALLSKSADSPSTTSYNIDLDIVDKSGWSPLIHASFNGHYDIVHEILVYQETKYKQEFDQETVEIEPAGTTELKYKHYFKQFLCRKVKWNGSTALHLACARGHESIVNLLITKMCTDYDIPLQDSINSIDYDLATPLHCAVLGKHYNICNVLLLHGALTNKCDIRGKTPLDWAQERRLTDYIQLLQKYKPSTDTVQPLELDINAINEAISSKVVESIWEEQERKSMETSNENTLNNSWNSLPLQSPTPDIIPHEISPSNAGNFRFQQHQNNHHTIFQPYHHSYDHHENQFKFNYPNNAELQNNSNLQLTQTPNNTPHANQPWFNNNNNGHIQHHQPHTNHNQHGPNSSHFSPHPQQQQFNAPHPTHFAAEQHSNHGINGNFNPYRVRAPRHIRYDQQKQRQQQQQQNMLNQHQIPIGQQPANLYRHHSMSPRPVSNHINPQIPPLTISKSWDPRYHPNDAQNPEINTAKNPSLQSTADIITVPSKVKTPCKSEIKTVDDGKLEENADIEADEIVVVMNKNENGKDNKNENENGNGKAMEDTKVKQRREPSLEALKFQNKYLEARCESLEKERREICVKYQEELSVENERWRLREMNIMKQLDAKQKQIHDLRHTMRRMRQFLDSLPVRIRRNFYRDNGNFSRELYDKQMMNDGCRMDKGEMRGNPKQKQKGNVVQNTTNGWKTVITEDLKDGLALKSESNSNSNSSSNASGSPKDRLKNDGLDGNEENVRNERNENGVNGGNGKGNKNGNKTRSKRYFANRKYGNNHMSRGNKMDSDVSWRRKR